LVPIDLAALDVPLEPVWLGGSVDLVLDRDEVPLAVATARQPKETRLAVRLGNRTPGTEVSEGDSFIEDTARYPVTGFLRCVQLGTDHPVDIGFENLLDEEPRVRIRGFVRGVIRRA
jgi:hypothetical protein